MIKKIIITVCVCLFFSLSAFAESFYIKNYNVDIKVDNTKKIHVTETIEAYFEYKSHGILREIPAPNAEISNIKVSEKHKNTQSGETYRIKIGNPDKYITGDHTYEISYDYNFLDNKKNEFYFNIIGTKWYTNINHVKFNVEMPYPFEEEKAGISIGKYGTQGFSEGEGRYIVSDKTVSGETLRVLEPKEGVTIRIELPKGYFVTNIVSKQNLSLLLILLCMFACIATWFIRGRDDRAETIISFYPPEGADVLDVELYYNEEVSPKGVVAMVIELAHKKFIKISDNKDGIVLEKLKEYDGSKEYEKTLIESIFGDKQTITEKQLKRSTTFYKAVKKIISEKNGEREKMFEPEEYNKTPRKIMQYIIGFLGIVLSFVCASYNPFFIWKGLIIIGAAIFAQWFVYLTVCDAKRKNMIIFFINLIILYPAFLFCLAFFEVMDYVYLPASFGYWCLFVSTLSYYHLEKRKKEILSTVGRVEGLKRFIKTAELNKLQMLVEEDPQYFYNILPYAYIFNLTNKWIKKFETLVIPESDWCNGSEFKEKEFIYFLKRMDDLSYPSCDNGGISSSSGGSSFHFSSDGGGGYSGGGGGGGGGSSW